MAMNRRDLLRTLGLGAGAAFLSPWVDRTLSHALGQSVAPRRRVIICSVVGFEPSRFVPQEVTTGRTQGEDRPLPPAVDPISNFTWPSMFAPIADLRQHTLLIDGLTNPVTGSDVHHGSGFGALTCRQPQGEPSLLAPPRGVSIDQYLAQTLSANAPKSSLLFGTSYDSFAKGRVRETSAFSAGTGQSLSHATKASALYSEIVSVASSDGSGDAMEAGRRQALRDVLSSDFSRLRQRLAGPERERLDVYETAIAEFDRRYELRENVSCGTPPSGQDNTENSRMESMMEMATLALECGLTNVVGMAVGTANSHDEHFPRYEGIGTVPVHEYNSVYGDLTDKVHHFHWGLLRNMIESLDQSGHPDDETIIVYMTPRGMSNYSAHHGQNTRIPLMMFAKSPNIQLGGRFLRYPPHERSLAEFFRSLAQVVGVCPDGFATGDSVVGPVRGLLDEVVGSTQSACG